MTTDTTTCRYCSIETTTPYVHPEFGTRYCSRAHADEHVGVAAWYDLHPDWQACADDYPRGPWRSDAVPPNVPVAPCAAPSGMVDGADVVERVFDSAVRRAYPTHCATCGKVAGERDRMSAEFPYCFGCYFSGAAYAHVHADLHAILTAHGLTPSWWHTGGGCWILAVVRRGVESWAEQEDGSFGPFVAIMGAYFDTERGEWHLESGAVERGETFGATYFPDESTWCGERMGDADEVAGVSHHDLAAFCLRHLPA